VLPHDAAPIPPPERAIVLADELTDAFAPLLALKRDVRDRALSALAQFQSNPQDPLEAAQRDVTAFFASFFEQLDSIGVAVIGAIEARAPVLKTVKATLQTLSEDFHAREAAAQVEMLRSLVVPFPEQRRPVQAIPEGLVRGASAYRPGVIGAPIRFDSLETVPCAVDPGSLLGRSGAIPRRQVAIVDFFDLTRAVPVDPFEHEDVNIESLGEVPDVVEDVLRTRTRSRKWTTRFQKRDDEPQVTRIRRDTVALPPSKLSRVATTSALPVVIDVGAKKRPQAKEAGDSDGLTSEM
jgi:hypothetical protein